MSKIILKRRLEEQALSLIPGLSPTLSRIARGRGVTHADAFDYRLSRLLPPSQLSNIEEACDLLAEAVLADAGVVVVGDFDADGATSSALAVNFLRRLGMQNVSYLVPDRFEFGYGLSAEIVGVAALRQPDLIITVDNGISSIEGVLAANALGISVLVTDHHLPGEVLPSADVIVNPNLAGDRFASKSLAGVGVVFYVMLALRARLRQMSWFSEGSVTEPNMSHYLDLVALGTVADVVPLDYNNRILVHHGLQRIRHGLARAGINALIEVASKHVHNLTSSDLGFAIGPRLNAAGRMDDMSIGIECLLTDDVKQAKSLAIRLDALNRERREVEQEMREDAESILIDFDFDAADGEDVCILQHENWHQGVVGLVASRIKDKIARPVFAFAPDESGEAWKGSVRSVKGVHIRDFLARVDSLHPGVIGRFGGHAMAAGLSVNKAKMEQFCEIVKAVAREQWANVAWANVVHSDGSLNSDDLSLQFVESLERLTPWGQGFPEPLFDDKFSVITAMRVGESHARLRLALISCDSVASCEVEAIYFNYFSEFDMLPEKQVHLVYQAQINEYQGQRKLQLLIRHRLPTKHFT